MNLKKIIRIGLAYCLYATGLLSLILWFRLRKKAVVLMYHRVLNGGEISHYKTRPGIFVETDTFRKQVRYIREYFNPVSLQEFVDHLERKVPFTSKSCLITFDDGWKDNFLNAYPVLRKNSIPSVIFIPTDYIGSLRSFWQEELTDLLIAVRRRFRKKMEYPEKNKSILDIEGVKRIIESDSKNLTQEIEAFLNNQKRESIAETERLIYSLKQALPGEATPVEKEPVFLNWDEVKTMARDGITFGSHGKSHALLPGISSGEVEREIRESKEILEKNLGQNIYAFSYPNGDYDENVAKAVQNKGYRVAFGTEKGFVSLGANPFSIHRVNIHQDMTGSIPMFLARIVGLC